MVKNIIVLSVCLHFVCIVFLHMVVVNIWIWKYIPCVGKLLVKGKLQLGFFFVCEMGCPNACVRCESG